MTIPCLPPSCTYAPTGPASGLRWMVFAGFAGDPNIVYCFSDDGTFVYSDSPLGRAIQHGDVVTTVGHPEPGRLDEYIRAIVADITGPTILVGLSTGGQLAEQVFQAAVAAGKLRYVYLVLGSTPETLDMLWGPQRFAVRLVSWLPDRLSRFVIRHGARFSVHRHAVQALTQTRRRWLVDLLRESFRRSYWIPDAMRLLRAFPGFGPTVVTADCVATLNLWGPDNVINVEHAVAAARRIYPNLAALTYEGRHHGEYELDARLVRDVLFGDVLTLARGHFAAHAG